MGPFLRIQALVAKQRKARERCHAAGSRGDSFATAVCGALCSDEETGDDRNGEIHQANLYR